MMKTKFIFFAIFLSFFIISNQGYSKEFRAKIYKISDGDTLWVKKGGKKIKLRLIGIDTPEKYESYKLKRDAEKCKVTEKEMKRLGILASKFAKSVLKKGEVVTVKTFGKGYYKRILAEIILPDGMNFNKLIVLEGYACSYKNREPYEIYEQIAKREKKGLWGKFYKIMDCLCR